MYLMFNRINGFVGVQNGKAEQPSEHGQPMGQTRSLFCTCSSGVARWRMNSMFEANFTGK